MRIDLDDGSLSFDLPWTPLEKCPCGLGQPYRYCCSWGEVADAIFRADQPVISPPGEITGIAHKRCFLNETNNCCEKISGEHYISQSVLSQMPNRIKISGAAWQSEGDVLITSAASLQSNILCIRHNNAFAPLDAVAGRVFERLRLAAEHATSMGRHDPYCSIIDGSSFELWGIQTLAGMYYSKFFATDGEKLFREYHLDMQLLLKAFFEDGIKRNCGLYIANEQGDSNASEIRCAPLVSDEKEVCGLTMQFGAARYNFFLNNERGNADYFNADNAFFRPNLLIFKGARNFSVLVCKWHEILRYKPTAVTLHIENRH